MVLLILMEEMLPAIVVIKRLKEAGTILLYYKDKCLVKKCKDRTFFKKIIDFMVTFYRKTHYDMTGILILNN